MKKVRMNILQSAPDIPKMLLDFSKNARSQNWTRDEINHVLAKVVQCGDYARSVDILIEHVEMPDEDRMFEQEEYDFQ